MLDRVSYPVQRLYMYKAPVRLMRGGLAPEEHPSRPFPAKCAGVRHGVRRLGLAAVHRPSINQVQHRPPVPACCTFAPVFSAAYSTRKQARLPPCRDKIACHHQREKREKTIYICMIFSYHDISLICPGCVPPLSRICPGYKPLIYMGVPAVPAVFREKVSPKILSGRKKPARPGLGGAG